MARDNGLYICKTVTIHGKRFENFETVKVSWVLPRTGEEIEVIGTLHITDDDKVIVREDGTWMNYDLSTFNNKKFEINYYC